MVVYQIFHVLNILHMLTTVTTISNTLPPEHNSHFHWILAIVIIISVPQGDVFISA